LQSDDIKLTGVTMACIHPIIFIVARIHPALMLVVYTTAKCYERAVDKSLDPAVVLAATSKTA
jgi:hypothetical protein